MAAGVNHQVLHANSAVQLLEDSFGEDHLLVVVGHTHESVGQIMSLLMQSNHEGFPVVDERNHLISLVSRVQLATALATANEPTPSTLINVAQLANTAPDITTWDMPLARAFHHFRSSGLKHLCVVDEHHELLGILTRTDFAKLCCPGNEGVEEIKSLITRKHAMAASGGLQMTLASS